MAKRNWTYMGDHHRNLLCDIGQVFKDVHLHGDRVHLGQPTALHVHHCVEKPDQAVEQVLLAGLDVEWVPAVFDLHFIEVLHLLCSGATYC